VCPVGSYIDGVRTRSEPNQGLGDDTGLNGLQIRCRNPNTDYVKAVVVHSGYWGSWGDWYIGGGDFFVNGAEVRFEDS